MAVNGKDAKSQGNFACPDDGRQELRIIKSSKLAILDGGVLSPPSDNKSYTDKSVKLLLRVLKPAAIIDEFQNAGYGPTKTKIYTLSKGLEKETSLSPAEQQRFDGMFQYFSQGMELDPEH